MRICSWDWGNPTCFIEGQRLPDGKVVVEKTLYGEEAEAAIAAEVERIKNIKATTIDQHKSTAE